MNRSFRRCLLSGFTFLFLMVAGSCATRSVIGQQTGQGGGTGTGGMPGTGTGGMVGTGTGGIVGDTGGMVGTGTGGIIGGTGGQANQGDGGSPLDGGQTCPPAGSSTDPSLSFGAAAEYLTHAGSSLVALGDLNGDGKPDFAVANYLSQSQSSIGGAGGSSGTGGSGTGGTTGTSPGSLSVFLSSTAGYGAPQFYTVGTSPGSVAAGDLNGDGKADLAVVNAQGVSVLFNDGTGKLLSPVSFATGTGPTWVAIGDLNGDGKADLAVSNQGSPNGSVQPVAGDVAVLLNMGGGTFVAANYPAGDSPLAVTMSDLNGDGKADLAVASGAGVSVLLNSGGGTFGAPANYGSGTYPNWVAAGDLNGDGKIDLAISNRAGGVSVLLNVGNGTFAAAVNYIYGSPYSSLAPVIGDLNGDGKPDLVAVLYAYPCSSVVVLLNQGSGVFGAPSYVPGIPTASSVTLGDLNADGKLDLVVPNGDGVAVLLNTAP